MLEAICGDCGTVFMACVILGITSCPDCGSNNTACAVGKQEKK